jgi:hypothetical protein
VQYALVIPRGGLEAEMNRSPHNLLPADFFQNLQKEIAKQTVPLLWIVVKAAWPYVLVVILVSFLLKLFTGKIGSLIYHFFYLAIFLILIAIWGLKITLNPVVDLIYPVSYLLTGWVLRKKERVLYPY